MIHPQLELLVTLHDLELMIKESTEEANKQEVMGFKIEASQDHLNKALSEVEKQVEPEILNRYKKLKQKYGRPVVPVINGVCCGCYIMMPTSQATNTKRNQSVTNCGNCGRFLYWPAV